MTDVHILAIDLAKRSFQVCATELRGAVPFNQAVSRAKLEAALRSNLHYVAVESAGHQARAVAFRTHQSFVGQRTPLINALR